MLAHRAQTRALRITRYHSVLGIFLFAFRKAGTGCGAHLLLIALPKAANPLKRKHKHVYPSIYTTNTLTTRDRSLCGDAFRKGPERQRRGRVSEGSAQARRFPAPGRRWRRPARCWPGASSTCAATSGWTWARRWCGEAPPLRPFWCS